MKPLCIQFMFILFFLSGCLSNPSEAMTDWVANDLSLVTWIDASSIDLPDVFEGVDLTWESSHPDIIALNGKISRVYQDTQVILTAHYVFNKLPLTKSFVLTVKGNPLSSEEIVLMDAEELSLDEVINHNLNLPNVGMNGSVIVWESSHPHILSKKGMYYMPMEETDIEMTATLIYEDARMIKTFIVTALAMPDEEKLIRDHMMLEIPLSSPTKDLILPTRGYFTSDITWTSSNIHVISDSGYYIKPIGSMSITLTATLTKGEHTMTKTFTIPVDGYDPDSFFEEIQKKLQIHHGISVIFDDVELPTTLLDIATITWESSHPDVLSTTGEFHYPHDTTYLTMKAHVTAGAYEKDVYFHYTVYGLNDQDTDIEARQLTSMPLDIDSLFHLDINEKLASGTFDQLMMKEGKLLIQGGYHRGTYISPVFHTDIFLNRMNLMWGSITHQTAKTEFFTRYLLDGEFTPWVSHGIWGYGGDNLPPSMTAHFAHPTQDIQYKIILMRDDIYQPSPQITFVSIQPVLPTSKTYTFEGLKTKVLYDVPQLKQADTLDAFLWNNICWATSISMMLNYYDKLKDLEIPQEYYSVLIRKGTERFGTTKNDIGATQFGIILHELEFHSKEMLLYVLNHYGPLIVGVSKGDSPDGKFGPLNYASGHVIVVVGYEIMEDGSIDIIVNDPAVSWMRFPIRGSLEDFMLVWDKGAMLMQPYPTH